MAKVEIYTTNYCPYCVKAKALLERKGQDFTEINVEDDAEREKMIERAGGAKTVPQIFINDNHVGGCDDLYALEEKGALDTMLND